MVVFPITGAISLSCKDVFNGVLAKAAGAFATCDGFEQSEKCIFINNAITIVPPLVTNLHHIGAKAFLRGLLSNGAAFRGDDVIAVLVLESLASKGGVDFGYGETFTISTDRPVTGLLVDAPPWKVCVPGALARGLSTGHARD
ncbi:hypothetical protein O9992_21005 [Vibrio lentus]|nr:hypothetical protein [Vibrio lentus]